MSDDSAEAADSALAVSVVAAFVKQLEVVKEGLAAEHLQYIMRTDFKSQGMARALLKELQRFVAAGPEVWAKSDRGQMVLVAPAEGGGAAGAMQQQQSSDQRVISLEHVTIGQLLSALAAEGGACVCVFCLTSHIRFNTDVYWWVLVSTGVFLQNVWSMKVESIRCQCALSVCQ